MHMLKRYSALFLFIVFIGGYSESSVAEDYYWTSTGLTAPDPSSLCSSILARYSASLNSAVGSDLYIKSIDVVDDTRRYCLLHYKRVSDGSDVRYQNILMSRKGDSCTSPAVYNSEAGACETEPDKCESTAGTLVYHEFKFKSLDTDGNPSTDPPITVCKDGCQYSHVFGKFSSKRDFGPPDMQVGSFEYKGNGTSCTASATDPSVFDQPPSKDPVKNAPEYATSNNCDKWVTQEDGTLKRSCTATTTYKNEGDVDCSGGTSGSGFSSSVTCTPSKSNPPEKTETKVDQVTETKTNTDGSTDTTTTTDTTKTECKGLSKCTSTSKTETEEESKDGDGNTDSTSSVCTGEGCNPDEEEEDSSSGDESEEEEEEGDTGKVSGESCSDTLSCEGDVIQCAILRKQKEQACAWEYDDVKSDIESAVEGEGYQLGEDSISLGDSFSEGSGASRWLSSGCPSSRSVSVMGHSYSLSWEPVCDFSRSLSYVIVAMAGVFFAVYVGRGLGGQ